MNLCNLNTVFKLSHGFISCLRAILICLACVATLRADQPTSILFILADDLGVGDLACYGNKVVDTPVIDSLAASGIRFTQHYAPSPLCAPSRAGFLTGLFNHRTGAVDVPSNRGLDRIALSHKTFGNYFQNAGYTTALIGKWHNGLYCRDYLPDRRGFDLFFGFPNGGQDYYKWNLLRNKTQQPSQAVPFDGRYLTDVLNQEACTFITAAHQQNQPFALFLAHHVPHVPFQAPERLIQKYRDKLKAPETTDKKQSPDDLENVAIIYAMIEAMDTGLGKVFQTLKDNGQWNNTVTVFTSDNGAWLGRYKGQTTQRFHHGLSGNKGDVGEQGINVPAIVAWSGHIPGRRVIDTPIHGCDWLPTLLSVTKTASHPVSRRALAPVIEHATTESNCQLPIDTWWPNTCRPDQAQRCSGNLPSISNVTPPEHRRCASRSGLLTSFPLLPSVQPTTPFDGINLMPLLLGQEMPELDSRQLPFQKNRYRPAAHSDAAIREGRWKLVWPGVAVTMKKDSDRDNPSYFKGLTEPHWEMPLDTQLDPVPQFQDPVPKLFDLKTDPAERKNVAADHPQLVDRLTISYDAWFADVMQDWNKSRQAIVQHDQAWWKNRPVEKVRAKVYTAEATKGHKGNCMTKDSQSLATAATQTAAHHSR